MADEQHVQVGEIIFLDDVVVLEGEKGRPVGPLRQQKRRRLGEIGRARLAGIGRHKALLEPFANWPCDLGYSKSAVGPLRSAHLVGPVGTALPAFSRELLV